MVLKSPSRARKGCRHEGFRPLAGFLLFSFPRHYGGSGKQREPMGALVPCVHFCRYGWFTACVHGAPSTALAGEALGYNGIIASPIATGEVASNASRWGRLCLAFISDTMKVYNLRPWRPLHRLRGPPPPLWQGRLEVRSVPLRGYGFEING